jgi:hypothetical protein
LHLLPGGGDAPEWIGYAEGGMIVHDRDRFLLYR